MDHSSKLTPIFEGKFTFKKDTQNDAHDKDKCKVALMVIFNNV